MVIAVAAKSNSAESEVGERFCTARCFQLIDTETHKVRVVDNGQELESTPEVQDRAADLMIDEDVDLVLADSYGPTALRVLTKAGIKAVGAVHGRVREIVENYEYDDDECPICAEAEPWWNWR